MAAVSVTLNAMTLLDESQRVVGAGEALTFVRQSAGKEEDLAFRFRAKQRKSGPQIAKPFGCRSLRSLCDQSISLPGNILLIIIELSGVAFFWLRFRYGGENGQSKKGLRLVHGLELSRCG